MRKKRFTTVLLGFLSWQTAVGFAAGWSQSAFVDRSYLVRQAIEPLQGSFTVALQPGHWQVNQLPDELRRLRSSTGAEYGSVREVDVNRSVVAALVPLLKAKGWNVLVVPATVPADLRADAFVAVHADWGDTPERRGWKLSPPWRTSPASVDLAEAMTKAFSQEPGFVHDAEAPTIQMRGYYGFNYIRYEHAISPFTPAVLVELGYLTNPEDRALLTNDPGLWASVLARGLENFFADFDRQKTEDLRPPVFSWQKAAEDVAVRSGPEPDSRVLWRLSVGDVVMPVEQKGPWYEVFVRRHRATGWIPTDRLVPTSDPHWKMPGETTSTTLY